MHPQLYNNVGVRIAELNNIIQDSATIKRVINGEFTFAFEAVEQELKSEYFDVANYLVIENQTFDIKCVEQRHETEVIYKIQCEHVNYRLQDGEVNSYESFNFVGTPTEILTEILTGTGFSIGTVSFTEEVYLSVNNQTNKKALIYELAKLVEGEVDYTASGFTINLLNTLGQDRGFQARLGRNLQGVTKIIDSRVLDNNGNIKVSYSVNLILLKNSNEYIAKGLQGLEVLDLGDAVRIIDEVIGLDVTNRVVSIEYNPLFQVNIQLEIANKLAIIVDSISRIDNTAVKRDDVYNGVRMGPAEGFVAERSDNKAKTIMNATEGISIYSDVGAGLVRHFYVDTNGRIQAKKIDVEGAITGGTITIGAGNNVFKVDVDGNMWLGDADYADAPFKVNKAGVVSATGVTISGAITLQANSSADFAYVSGATKPANNATVGADWSGNLMNIPSTLQAPSGSGLYLSPTYLGFYDSSAWKTYMDNSGNFYLGGATGKLQWVAGSNTLTIDGGAVVNGTITGSTIQTAESGARTRVNASGITTFSTGDTKHGIEACCTSGTNNLFSVYNGGNKIFEVDLADAPTTSLRARKTGATNDMSTFLEIYQGTSKPMGTWNFNEAVITNLNVKFA